MWEVGSYYEVVIGYYCLFIGYPDVFQVIIGFCGTNTSPQVTLVQFNSPFLVKLSFVIPSSKPYSSPYQTSNSVPGDRV